MTPEQEKEIRQFRERESNVRKELKVVRRQSRKEVDALETRLKWINIAAMPLLVTAAGVTLASIKRKKTAAK